MEKLLATILVLFCCLSCTKSNKESLSEIGVNEIGTERIVDSLLYYKHRTEQTDILSQRLPEMSQEQAISIQLVTLRKELASGAQLIGWKMGGTVTNESEKYNPLFGYILDSNVIEEDSVISLENFPGNRTMVEGEIGFVMRKDFPNGASSIEELKKGIDYVVNAVEFAQDIAIPVRGKPDTKNINHTLAAGMGQAGFMLGTGQAEVGAFNMKNEVARCFINDSLSAEGISTNVYGGPLNALYSLTNMLPKYGRYLRKGDIIITGSLYENPTINSAAKVQVVFSTLGTINFSVD